MNENQYSKIAKKIFSEIQEKNPEILMVFYDDPNYDLSIDIPVQDNMMFELFCYQDFDTLGLQAGNVTCEFFPITEDEIMEEYINAVSGLLKGSYRIVSFSKAHLFYKSILQKETKNGWKTVFTDHNRMIWPWTKVEKEIFVNRTSEQSSS
jgi:hypothetical protein